MSASQQPQPAVPGFIDYQSGIRSLAEIQQREPMPPAPKRKRGPNKPSDVWAVKMAPRYAEIAQALRERPLHVPYHKIALAIGAARLTLRKVAKAEGISLAYVRIKAVKAVRLKAPEAVPIPVKAKRPPAASRSHNVPKQPEVPLFEIPCICCQRWFKSWDKKLNRMCKPCKESA